MKNRNLNYELIEQCKKGNSKAQFEIYKLYSKAMYNTSLRIIKDEAEAEDIIQESFLIAFKNINTLSGELSFGAWLKKIVINKSLDFLKKRKIEFENIENIKLIDKEEDEENTKNETLELKVNKIKDAIMKLPDGYRIILSLYLLEGYDHNEISEILDISASSSRSQLARAKTKLIKLLTNNN
ncbi:MAG: sigma-70 family RNA polymerase sigma factor [Bacteroidales bacterium]|nr:sigma-70 family RNA polymerase sigma factor [Bacteroidales bacterium]MBN2755623.1 sigma-70 family RNA polymerase sigma factor [Bacteroidales bacterium]